MGRVETNNPLLEVGVAAWALQPESGDAYAVTPFPGGVLVAVVDGLGHGKDAARAATAASRALASDAAEEPAALLTKCHDAVRGTRGAVVSLASIRNGTMSWLGVGNVEGVLVRADAWRQARFLPTRGGVVGHDLPPLGATEEPIRAGDTLVFATDGVDNSRLTEIDPNVSAQANADRMLAEGCKRNDDALVVVARYHGAPA